MGGTNINIASGAIMFQFLGGDAGGFNPADTTPFFVTLGAGTSLTGDPSTTAPTVSGYSTAVATVPMTITRVDMIIAVIGTLGTTETGSLAILVNNTTATTVINNTLAWNIAGTTYSATGLSVALAKDDFFVCKVTPPNWATNPTVTFYVINVYATTH